jgi:hypothetical protein
LKIDGEGICTLDFNQGGWIFSFCLKVDLIKQGVENIFLVPYRKRRFQIKPGFRFLKSFEAYLTGLEKSKNILIQFFIDRGKFPLYS